MFWMSFSTQDSWCHAAEGAGGQPGWRTFSQSPASCLAGRNHFRQLLDCDRHFCHTATSSCHSFNGLLPVDTRGVNEHVARRETRQGVLAEAGAAFCFHEDLITQLWTRGRKRPSDKEARPCGPAATAAAAPPPAPTQGQQPEGSGERFPATSRARLPSLAALTGRETRGPDRQGDPLPAAPLPAPEAPATTATAPNGAPSPPARGPLLDSVRKETCARGPPASGRAARGADKSAAPGGERRA